MIVGVCCQFSVFAKVRNHTSVQFQFVFLLLYIWSPQITKGHCSFFFCELLLIALDYFFSSLKCWNFFFFRGSLYNNNVCHRYVIQDKNISSSFVICSYPSLRHFLLSFLPSLYFIFFFFWPGHTTFRILVSSPGIDTMPFAMEA